VRRSQADERSPVTVRRVDGQHVSLPTVGVVLDPSAEVPAAIADELIASGVYEAVPTEVDK